MILRLAGGPSSRGIAIASRVTVAMRPFLSSFFCYKSLLLLVPFRLLLLLFLPYTVGGTSLRALLPLLPLSRASRPRNIIFLLRPRGHRHCLADMAPSPPPHRRSARGSAPPSSSPSAPPSSPPSAAPVPAPAPSAPAPSAPAPPAPAPSAAAAPSSRPSRPPLPPLQAIESSSRARQHVRDMLTRMHQDGAVFAQPCARCVSRGEVCWGQLSGVVSKKCGPCVYGGKPCAVARDQVSSFVSWHQRSSLTTSSQHGRATAAGSSPSSRPGAARASPSRPGAARPSSSPPSRPAPASSRQQQQQQQQQRQYERDAESLRVIEEM